MDLVIPNYRWMLSVGGNGESVVEPPVTVASRRRPVVVYGEPQTTVRAGVRCVLGLLSLILFLTYSLSLSPLPLEGRLLPSSHVHLHYKTTVSRPA